MRNLSQKIILFLFLSLPLLAQSPHGDNFNLDCELCHQPTSWKIDVKKVKFDHNQTKFELIGQHKAADCRGCHISLLFDKEIETDCISCHTDIHQGTVGFDCSRCHTPNSWMVEDINGLHQQGRFPLVGNHLTADCQQCHSRYTDLYFEPLDVDCYACHANDFQIGHSASDPKNCEDCHDLNATSWSTINVNHDFFPLVGGHAISNCFACHILGQDYSNISPECFSCHQDDYNQTTDPNHLAENFPTDCEQCHTIFGWEPATFDHNTTAFPLTGSHITTDCISCHETGYTNTPTDCFACHIDDYNGTTDPNHQTENFPHDCEQCHNTSVWSPSTFDHNATTFPLTGAHISAECSSCHAAGYTNTPTDCFACHAEDYNQTTDPNHVASSFPTTCAVCHNTTAWQPAEFDHNLTSFPLTGQHITVECIDCHASGYTGTPTECVACHQEDFNQAAYPNHITSGFPTTCEDCHTTSGWSPANFDHSFYPISSDHNDVTCNECHSQPNYQPQCLNCHLEDFNDGHNPGDPTDCWGCHSTSNWDTDFNHDNTNFPLTGAHTTVSCQDCHSSGYQGTPTDCVACHQTNYNNTTNPDHEALMLPTQCDQCHTTTPGWQPATFPIHDQFYLLIGAHANISNCDDCHSGDYSNTPNTCIGCHQDDYNGTTDPPHQTLNFSNDCTECHNMNSWTPANFDHSFYPISNDHNNVECNECHSQPNYQPQCLSCHQDDFNDGHDPGDPTDCWGCHSTSNWDSDFNHDNTNFPLTGAHTSVSCQDCHSGGYQGTPTECVACHQDNYNNTTNPDHQVLMLPTDCDQCHTTNQGWQPATFPIHDQFFQLLGAHLNITNCDDCHNGNYVNPPSTCIGCHQTDYNGTTDPPHQILNFPTNCLECHNMNGWTPANFDHGFYPISNDHNNVQCNECHSQPNYEPQCLSCHQDDFNEGHDPGDPTDCWGCHSTSNWDSNFDHNNTNFPLTGAHISVPCLSCHAGGYQGTPTDCVACHQDNYNNTTNPDHQVLMLPTDCDQCHTTNQGWQPAAFPIHDQFFQLLGAHANITNCDDCHNGNYNSTPNTCIGCHQDEYNSTTDPPHQTLNFSFDCTECHGMNGWTPASFNHSFFPLSGNHDDLDCSQCHSEFNYQPQCLSCHLDDFLDEHDQGDPTDCWNCHSTSDWDGPGVLQTPKLD